MKATCRGSKDKLSDADIWVVISYIERTWPQAIRDKEQRMNVNR
jgi:predicted nucleotidyltransferase